ncbi:MAG: T9SS type A sorting domain-containing protein [Rhodothermaceae bacterium]|nr:T9SS type A sorting domain-containing protein [Rhodothermaceae bacterium]MYC03546.1 T9SS type A sorting domain-containing protein [Rhodothermaceae bacterium]MYI17795.1 T9SS type A sorting domain-containing protein [Rhodothermaceae bacterium]
MPCIFAGNPQYSEIYYFTNIGNPMKHTLTPLLTLALVLVGVTNVQGQAGPPLGDDFIFFVDEISTMVPENDLMVVDDPTDATNKVIEFGYADYSFNAFRWPADVGVDISQNREDGDVLHARIWVDSANIGKGRIHIMFEDKTDGNNPNEGGDAPFRLALRIPDWMRNSQWHEISAPLPPATYEELEAAREAGKLTGDDSLWVYAGAWSQALGEGIGLDDRLGPNTEQNPDLWEEFEWTNVQTLGVQFDHQDGGNSIYIDDVYIGAADLLSDDTTPGDAGPPLGDNFVFFVNGVNTMVPEHQGNVIDDPSDPTNKIMEYTYGDWSFQAFRFPADVGRDMTQNRADGDVLHARIWVDPENAGKPNVQLLMEDKALTDPGDDGALDDLPFRLVWRIPESMRDGQWHEISVPLPPATYTELEDAKAANELDGLDSLWKYAGAWSSRGYGVGVGDELGPNTVDNPDQWKEYEWTNVQNLGVHFDNNQGGGPIYLDDVYIGAVDLDLSDQNAPPPAAMGVSAAATADSNTVSWTSIADAASYKVYFSTEEFTSISDPGVGIAAQVGGDATSAGHKIEVPHESLLPLTLHYAVTTLSSSGVENEDISSSTASVANENLPLQAHISELTTDELEHLTDLLFGDSFDDVTEMGFPEGYMPFELNMDHFKPADAGLPAGGDEDLSGKLWGGYSANPPELYLYVEVTDDQTSLQAAGGNPGEGWQHDSIEFGWGNYDVREVAGGGIFTGTPHQDITRGEFADYQFRIGGQGDGTKAGTEAYAFVGWSIDAVPQGGGAIYDQLMDDNGMVIGYKILSLFPMDQIQKLDNEDGTPDAVTPLPTGDEISYFPFNFVLNDGDGGNRDAQIQWSIKSNADGQWWNTPAQWPPVALVGRTVETEDTTRVNIAVEELPGEIVLDQNYPNPFNPSTSIQFSLPASESVTLRVFDAMGRTVATLLDRKPHVAGKHTVQFNAEGMASGIYFYRLETGSSVLMTRRMILIK